MIQQRRSLAAVIAVICLAVLWPVVGRSDQNIAAAQDAIQKATQRALTALLSPVSNGYSAALHVDFIQIDSTGKVTHQSKKGHRGFVTPQTFTTDEKQEQPMQLFEATSTITSISMPSENEAIVIGEDVLRWQGKHGDDIRQVTADGQVAITGNTEIRTVQVQYQRHWVRDNKGTWLLKRSHTLSEHAVAVL